MLFSHSGSLVCEAATIVRDEAGPLLRPVLLQHLRAPFATPDIRALMVLTLEYPSP